MPDDVPPILPLLTAAILLTPFAGFLVLLRAGHRSAGRIAVLLTGLGLVASVVLAMSMPVQSIALRINWVALQHITFDVGFRLDTLTALMLMLVHGVALLVQLYSISYLHDEPRLPRYFSYLQLFVGAMLGIVLAGDLIIMYAFWELVGLASYLLIGFYTERPSAVRAAKKAFLMNRIGDVGFLIGIFLTYFYTNATELPTEGASALPTVVGLCLFMGCVGKSAQFPLLTWLPDAMEGPTPVSALLHAATMVAAGIFLLLRIYPILSPDALSIIALVGTITAMWGGYSAVFQHDIKKVLAFSTVSQLGLMVAGVGTGNPTGALFHLLTHAFFKAGLFLSAGAVIHGVETQDMRHMGGLRKTLPGTFVAYTVCAAALAGLPLLSGFLSKEVILAGAFQWADVQDNGLAYAIPALLLLSSGLTALYMVRQWQMVFFGPYRNHALPLQQVHEPDALMRIPVGLLALLSIGFWFSLNPFHAQDSWFFDVFAPATETAEVSWLAPVSIALVALGGYVGFLLRNHDNNAGAMTRSYVRLSVEYGFLDAIYQFIIIKPIRQLATLLYRTDQRVVDGAVNGLGVGSVVTAHLTNLLDRWGVDGVVNGAAWVAGRLGRLARSVQNGRVQSYITAAVVGLLLMLWWLL
ncbi:proton-translocating NADH-quinone oxidoreductase, chain L [Fibrisoma limi BUZ 3]|uniref:Proton-translocating NADH-quinone oxidoreductase, chain L n=1 Tax=Fibrisoma limi BUZ 3 TaxID=1185876 RepID=I2GSX5_9BACT|nr:NADH-quinone oxidoreductase subunit L [Fibrisoma limi]CCH57004.1 proton-translocating NADH-quinone oxidoreductase, chain L [Fibrisoma limi BUZ 3]